MVSIHTPIQGVTFRPVAPSPRARVSIHTPIQGVTCLYLLEIVYIIVSIHTPIQGVTPPGATTLTFYRSFNPHTHTGCDVILIYKNTITKSFNPHTHTGCDILKSPERLQYYVSIHTPIQGVTSLLLWCLASKSVSIHTPIQGVTHRGCRCEEGGWGFNPHTHTGCDLLMQVKIG